MQPERQTPEQESYIAFKPNMLLPDTIGPQTTVTAIRDPFGNSYGYSTANQAAIPSTTTGYNPTFDLVEHGRANYQPARRRLTPITTAVDQKLVSLLGRFCETRTADGV